MTTLPQSLGMPFAQFVPIANSQGTSMQPAMIKCENRRADGLLCGEAALIHATQYIYTRQAGSIGTDPDLREAHYTIECPKCGRINQIVEFG